MVVEDYCSKRGHIVSKRSGERMCKYETSGGRLESEG